MNYYTIWFDGKLVYEGDDGKYWLGGTKRHMHHLIFVTKKEAEQGLKDIKIRIEHLHTEGDLFSRFPENLSVGMFKVVKV